MVDSVVPPRAAIADTNHNSIIKAGGIGLGADFEHPAIVACGILPCCERRSAYIAALKDCLVGLPRLCRLQQHGRIQGSLNVQVACHRIPGFVHSAQIAPGCRSRCPAGTTPGDRDCSVQLGTAMVDIPVRVNLHSICPFGDFSDCHTVASLPEENGEGRSTNIEHFLDGIELIRQGEFHLEGVVDINRSVANNGCGSVRQCDRRGISAGCTERILHFQGHAVLVADRGECACCLG